MFNDRKIARGHHKEPPRSVEMEVTVSARADAERAHAMVE